LLDPSGLTVVTATGLETREARRALPDVRVVRVGVAFASAPKEPLGTTVISCGLAGGLRADLHAGAVLIPQQVVRPNGERMRCDPALVRSLQHAARRLGFEAITDPIVTSDRLIRGFAREVWAARGFCGADMETGLIYATRVAAVRVVLDSPAHELSDAWLDPLSALLRPSAWLELAWLAREGPRCARRAAEILRESLAAP
jgi:hypothetical protein